MSDIQLTYGTDLVIAAGGDLLLSSGSQLTQDRVLRRLLTAPTALVFNPTYGGGLGQMIGTPANARRISAVIRSQVNREATVAASPPPTVSVSVTSGGTVTASISYADANTGSQSTLSVPVS